MPSEEEIKAQQELLNAYRRTLFVLLKQRAQIAASYVPPAIATGIEDARDNIRHIKQNLRAMAVPTDDQQNDEDLPLRQPSITGRLLLGAGSIAKSSNTGWYIGVIGLLVAMVAVGFVLLSNRGNSPGVTSPTASNPIALIPSPSPVPAVPPTATPTIRPTIEPTAAPPTAAPPTAAPPTAAPPTATPATVADGIYNIQSLGTGYRLDGNPEKAIYGQPPNGGDYQKWRITLVGDNSYTIESLGTGYRLDGNPEKAIYGQPPNGGDYQKWRIILVGDNSYTIESLGTGYRLDGNPEKAIYGQPPNGGDYQKWLLKPT